MISTKYSPYEFFSSQSWQKLQNEEATTPRLTNEEIKGLRSLGDPVDLDEIKRIYLSLSQLLFMHVEINKTLFEKRCKFLKTKNSSKMPYIIAIAGSVAVGKSTTARVLKRLLECWSTSPKVDLVTTDGFLYPNKILESRNLMGRKGFPESYDFGRLIRFLSDVKSGKRNVVAPVYSHLIYDVKPDEFVCIDQPDVLIVEGVNVLQPGKIHPGEDLIPFLSDFFDFSIYIDAEENLVHDWYIERFMQLRETAFKDKRSFFYTYSQLSEQKACAIAEEIWEKNNLKNLRENILPTRSRSDLILRKGKDHLVREVGLRRL